MMLWERLSAAMNIEAGRLSSNNKERAGADDVAP
jgi:hypothetical protein